MHISNELWHYRVDVLPQKLMRSISNDIDNFWCWMLNNSDIFPFSWDYYRSAERVVSIFLLFYIALDLDSLEHRSLSSFNRLLTSLINFSRVDNHLHEVCIKDHAVNIVRVKVYQSVIIALDLLQSFDDVLTLDIQVVPACLFWL